MAGKIDLELKSIFPKILETCKTGDTFFMPDISGKQLGYLRAWASRYALFVRRDGKGVKVTNYQPEKPSEAINSFLQGQGGQLALDNISISTIRQYVFAFNRRYGKGWKTESTGPRSIIIFPGPVIVAGHPVGPEIKNEDLV